MALHANMSGADLQKFRQRHGWTQAELADKLGVARNTVARWERDEMAIPPFLWLSLKTIERESKK